MLINYDACFDELAKIAEAQEKDRWVTKDRLKRFGTAALAAGAGAGLATGVHRVIHKKVLGTKSPVIRYGKKIPRGVLAKYGPALLGAAAAGGAALKAKKSRLVRQAIEGNKDKK